VVVGGVVVVVVVVEMLLLEAVGCCVVEHLMLVLCDTDERGGPIDVITLAIASVAIAGPTLLALALYWRNKATAAEGAAAATAAEGATAAAVPANSQLAEGSNPPRSPPAAAGRRGDGALTCGLSMPVVTARTRRAPGVPGVMRT
jgi:hypothetical protein